MFDSDKAATRCTRMWKEAGELFVVAAKKLLERGFDAHALECFKRADACFWQATGESDTISIKDFNLQPKGDA